MTKKKKVDPIDKGLKELMGLIIVPLYPAMIAKHEPSVEIINKTLDTFKPIGDWRKDTTSSVCRADVRMSLIQLKEAVEKYSDEATRKAVLKKIDQLEEVTIGVKK